VLLLALALITTDPRFWKVVALAARHVLGHFLPWPSLIIFQPELRRMLAKLGNLPLFVSMSEQRESIEVIIQTVERLARRENRRRSLPSNNPSSFRSRRVRHPCGLRRHAGNAQKRFLPEQRDS